MRINLNERNEQQLLWMLNMNIIQKYEKIELIDKCKILLFSIILG